MNLIDLTIEHRGFARRSIAISMRTAGACHGMRYRPDCRILCGIGLFLVEPSGDSFRFQTLCRYLGPDDTPLDLLDWLQALLPAKGAIISWDKWLPVPRRIAALADPERHSTLLQAAQDIGGRWRDLQYSDIWYLKQARSMPVPCVCLPHVQAADCEASAPLSLLPNATVAEPQLINEAIAGWQAWARMFAGFDSDLQAAGALRALEAWRTAAPNAGRV